MGERELTVRQRHLVQRHLGLVRQIASNRRFRGRASPDELYSYGCDGLVSAAHDFPGGNFDAYAAPAIRVAIGRGLADLCPWGRWPTLTAWRVGRVLPAVGPARGLEDLTPDPHDEVGAVDDADQVAAALALLSGPQRALVADYYLHGVSQADIAQRLGCRENAVCHQIGRAVRRLRQRLQPV